jgi:hypothetical protein
MNQRQAALSSIFTQLAVHFADLHDTPARMEELGVIEGIVPWKQARKFFYGRLVRKLKEKALKHQLRPFIPSSSSSSSSNSTIFSLTSSRQHQELFLSSILYRTYMLSRPKPRPRESRSRSAK